MRDKRWMGGFHIGKEGTVVRTGTGTLIYSSKGYLELGNVPSTEPVPAGRGPPERGGLGSLPQLD